MSNWKESQFKKAKVCGNESLWEEAANALDAKLLEDNLVYKFKQLQRQHQALQTQVLRLHAELGTLKKAG